MYVQNHHLASDGLQFEKCRTLVLKSVGARELLTISKEMKSISQKKMRIGPPDPQMRQIQCPLRVLSYLGVVKGRLLS